MSLFTEVDRLKVELDAFRPLAPEQEARVLQKFRLEWNYNSNAIEGNSLTLGETRSLLLHGLTAAGKPMRDHLDIKGHNEAVVALEEFVRSEYPLTEQFIREMHQLLLGEPYHTPAQTAGGQSTRKLIVPGRYKTSPNNVLTATGEMFYFASTEETPGRMTDLVDWYRTEEAAPTLHPVALAVEFHYRFVRIHPFDDGNGRMSRLLMNLILLRHGYPMTVIQAADRNRYLTALAQADANEFEPFLQFIIENVENSLRLMIRAARGESIDEPSDLDKKLALLKVQLAEGIKNQAIVWGISVQQNQLQLLITAWIEDLFNQTQRFDFAFNDKIYASYVRPAQGDPKPQYAGPFATSDKSIDFIKSRASEGELLREAYYYIQWNSFKSQSELKTKDSFKPTLSLGFEFHKTEFQVRYSISQGGGQAFGRFDFPLFHALQYGPYQTQYNQAEISKMNYQLAEKLYDFITTKLAEADTPPA